MTFDASPIRDGDPVTPRPPVLGPRLRSAGFLAASAVGRLLTIVALLVLRERTSDGFGVLGLALSASTLASAAAVAGLAPLTASGELKARRPRTTLRATPVLILVSASISAIGAAWAAPDGTGKTLGAIVATCVIVQAVQLDLVARALHAGKRHPGAVGAVARGCGLVAGSLVVSTAAPFWAWAVVLLAAESLALMASTVAFAFAVKRESMSTRLVPTEPEVDEFLDRGSRVVALAPLVSWIHAGIGTVAVGLVARFGGLAETGNYALAVRLAVGITFVSTTMSMPATAAAAPMLSRSGRASTPSLRRAAREPDVAMFLAGSLLALVAGVSAVIVAIVAPESALTRWFGAGLLAAIGVSAVMQTFNQLMSVTALAFHRSREWLASDVAFGLAMGVGLPFVNAHPVAATLIVTRAAAALVSSVFLFQAMKRQAMGR